MDITTLSRTAFESAIKRKKTKIGWSPAETAKSIQAEVKELSKARPFEPSPHIHKFTEVEEELVDILICCLTELYARGCNVQQVLEAKIEYNAIRED